jgi:hypothetical protein
MPSHRKKFRTFSGKPNMAEDETNKEKILGNEDVGEKTEENDSQLHSKTKDFLSTFKSFRIWLRRNSQRCKTVSYQFIHSFVVRVNTILTMHKAYFYRFILYFKSRLKKHFERSASSIKPKEAAEIHATVLSIFVGIFSAYSIYVYGEIRAKQLA